MNNKTKQNNIRLTQPPGVPGLAALALGLTGALLAPATAHAAPTAAPKPNTTHRIIWGSRSVILKSVILKINGPLTAAREAALTHLGADVTRHLGLIGSVAVTVPGHSLARIAALPFVTHVSDDGQVKKCDEFTVGASGAGTAYQQYGLTGQGVTVAVLDSGIEYSHWDFLNAAGNSQVTAEKDLVTGGSGYNEYLDYCGHGTHVAGIIAGNGAASTGSRCTHTYYGIARKANLVNVRVLDSNGQGSVSTVLAGLQWVVANKAKYNIRVLNLSLGHPVGESYTTDPLCQGVEAAWKAGIVVVCAAGNSGRANAAQTNGAANEGWGTAYGSIQSPANDPYVITVGATKNFDGNRWHDRIATYSSRGPSRLDLVMKPDIIAPGNKVISLDVDWATLNAQYGTTNLLPYSAYTTAVASGSAGSQGASNRAGAGMSNAYFVLSGTSMAAPVVAGAAALLLQQNPSLSPDTIKARLMVSADKWAATNGVADPCTYGAGYLDIPAALKSTVVATRSALSPALIRDSSGNVFLDTSKVVSGSHLIWGSTGLTDLHIIWGSSALTSGSLSNTLTNTSASHIIWGSSVWSDHIIWGSSGSSVDLSSVAIKGE